MNTLVSMVVASALFLHVGNSSAQDTKGLALRLQDGDERIYLFIDNQGSGEAEVYPEFRYGGALSQVEYRFFNSNGECKACKLLSDPHEPTMLIMPLRPQTLLPGQVFGTSVRKSELKARYRLQGCYAVIATYRNRSNPGAVSRRLVSNVERLCF